MEVSGQLHAPAALPPREKPVPIGKEAGWASGHDGEDKESHPVARIEPRSSSA